MKSKVTFDLNYANKPIVLVEAVSTEDVRDKIATRFIDKLGDGNCTICMAFKTSSPHTYASWNILPLSQSEEDAEKIVFEMDLTHRVTLFKELKKSLDISVKEGVITKEYGTIK